MVSRFLQAVSKDPCVKFIGCGFGIGKGCCGGPGHRVLGRVWSLVGVWSSIVACGRWSKVVGGGGGGGGNVSNDGRGGGRRS